MLKFFRSWLRWLERTNECTDALKKLHQHLSFKCSRQCQSVALNSLMLECYFPFFFFCFLSLMKTNHASKQNGATKVSLAKILFELFDNHVKCSYVIFRTKGNNISNKSKIKLVKIIITTLNKL